MILQSIVKLEHNIARGTSNMSKLQLVPKLFVFRLHWTVCSGKFFKPKDGSHMGGGAHCFGLCCIKCSICNVAFMQALKTFILNFT